MKFTSALKVGILTLVALIILIMSINWLKGRSISAGERIEIRFSDVAGLRPGATVQIMGLRVGQVEEILPVIDNKKNYIKVKFVITEPQVEIPDASIISIQQSGIIGEKFLEITPPQVKTIYLPKKDKSTPKITNNNKVKVFIDGNYYTIGDIIDIKVVDSRTLAAYRQDELKTPYAYKINYCVTKNGIILPSELRGRISELNNLVITPLKTEILRLHTPNKKYTIVEPVRFSEFIDVQFQAARAFNDINNKINSLLSDEVLDDTKVTLKNIKNISIAASDTIEKANELISSSKDDIEKIIKLANGLTKEVTKLTINLNDLISDKDFKGSIKRTAKSIEKTSNVVNDLLKDKDTRCTLKYIKETTKNLSEISTFINEVTSDDEFKYQINSTVKNLNKSLIQLDKTLGHVSELSPEDKAKIKDMLVDSAEASKNLKKFSKKLNKRFLLFRLMF